MKKLILFLALGISVNCLSQAITVDTNKYSATELVNTVLINSPCVSATNITSKTGSDFGSTNGIGFFKNTNPNFPIKSGVILSTGNANSAVGPNTTEQNEGSSNWPGDTSLEKTLLQSGITMSSTNASLLEFDFTPISPSFNFKFLFASEEYGNYQCQFSDAFVFLLTNMTTGVTTNLAVVPNTNLPISVVTIRDYLYNSSCPSVNAQYFGTYNGGSAAAESATNFNGQTALLNASATLIPNTPYHIKLVIADRLDTRLDSAIFLASDSFNIGQDVLGSDLTVANNNAVCFGDTHVLNTNLDPAAYTFSWTKDGVVIPGANGANLSITQLGTYGVTYAKTTNSCQPTTDFIKVEYFSKNSTKDPVNIYKCDTGANSYEYDLSLNTTIVKTGLNPETEVNYYATLEDANLGINMLPKNYTSVAGKTVYVQIKNYNSSCFIIKPFQLLTTPAAVAYQPADMTQCATSATSNSGAFKFSSQNNFVLKGQSTTINSVSYYISATNANNAINPLDTNNYLGTNNTIIYARVDNMNDKSCYSVTSFKIIVKPLPLVDKLDNVETCNNYILPSLINGNYFTGPNGTGDKLFAGDVISKTKIIYIFNQPDAPNGCPASSSFKVTIVDGNTALPKSGTYCKVYNLPSFPIGNYYTQPNGGGVKIAFGTPVTSTNSFYYFYKSKTDPTCTLEVNFTITIVPIQEVGLFNNVFDCDSYTLPSLTVGNYYTQPNGGGTKLEAGAVITTSQKIYVYSTTGSPNNCVSETSFNVTIGIKIPSDVNQCGSYTLPVIPIGKYYTGPAGTGISLAPGALISETTKIYIYAPSASIPNCTDNLSFNVSIGQPKIDVLDNITSCDYYTLPSLVIGGTYYSGPNETGTILNAGDQISSSKTIYIFKRTGDSCSNQSSFMITINSKPNINSRSDIDICNFYELTPLSQGDYYTGPGGTGTKLTAGTILKSSQTIYVYATTNNSTNCTNENSFKINIYSIKADAPANVTACDSYTLPALKIGNYYSSPGGPVGGAGSLMHAGDVITTTKTLYVYTESGERINCTDENSFVVTINQTPVVTKIADVNAYDSYTLPSLLVGNYFTGTNATGTPLKAGDIIKTSQSIYVFAQTATTPNCSDEKTFKIDLFNVDELSDVTICENYVLPVLNVGNYFTGQKGTGIHLNAGQTITSSQTIYIYGTTPLIPIGYDESSFAVTIVNTPIAYAVPDSITTICDDGRNNNDRVATFDLTIMDSIIAGNQIAPEFTVKYYASQEDAVAEKNAITSSNLPTVFVRVSNTLTANCFDLKPIAIHIIKAPSPTPKGGIVCYDSKTKTVLNSYVISSGLSASTHLFKWLDESGTILGTASTYEAVLPGTYTLIATSTVTGCSSYPISVEVAGSEPAVVAYTISDDFANNQIVTIEATGTGGNYEYQLDSGSFQDSPIFQNLSLGTHSFTVRDKNGCGNSVTQALVINYPKFFTPNGDGFNDTWNITSLKDQPNSLIAIYDRYGKLLTEIKPNGQGWDGTYSGQMLPSTDYWFTASFVEDGISKEFKSHFSMKR